MSSQNNIITATATTTTTKTTPTNDNNNGSSTSSNNGGNGNAGGDHTYGTTSNTTTWSSSSPQASLPLTTIGLTQETTLITSTASTAIASALTPLAPHVVSHATVDALGDLLLESASVQSAFTAHEQRRKHSYKSNALINKTMKQSQEERRKIALSEQAKKRYQFTNHARKLALFASGEPSEGSSSSEDEEDQDDDEEDDDDDEAEEEDEASPGVKRKKKRSNKAVRLGEARQQEEAESLSQNKTQKRRLSSGSGSDSAGKKDNGDHDALSPKKPRLQKASPKVNRKKKKKNKNPFRDQLMIPETMTDIPSDLDTSYYIVPLPIGHRCFVISADGRTMARLPTGQLLVSPFESCLPAGSSQYRGNRRSDYCILDCVYSSVTRTFWTLDIMCWRGHPVYECETEFRFWWLRGKLAEIESLQAKWIATQTREWEQEQAKKRQKKARQIKKRQERAALASATVPMDIASIQSALESDMILQEEGDDGDDEAGTETMEAEHYGRTGCAQPSATTARKTFWPIVFTPLPYFNASVDLVRLLAEVMYQPTPAQSSTASPMMLTADDQADPGSVVIPSSSLQPSLVSAFEHPSSAGAAILDQQRGSISVSSSFKTIGGSGSTNRGSGTLPTVRTYREAHSFGTMALTGEIATAASLFPAHDATQRSRQGQALGFERAAGLVFFNKKTMYVLGTTPLCGWLTMDQIGDVFFGEEGGVGPVAGTSAVEGREVEMEDALERIRI